MLVNKSGGVLTFFFLTEGWVMGARRSGRSPGANAIAVSCQNHHCRARMPIMALVPPMPSELWCHGDFFLGNKQRKSKQRGFSRQLLLPPQIEHY